jgi:Histidine kinase
LPETAIGINPKQVGRRPLVLAYNRLAVNWARGSALLGCLLTAGDLRVLGSAGENPLTAIDGVKAFSALPAGRTRVDLRAVATFFDAKEGVLYLQDVSGAMALRIGNPGAAITSGTRLRVTGELVAGSTPAVVEGARVTALELAPSLTDARPVSVEALLEDRATAEWVQLRGTIGAVGQRGDSLLLELQDEGRRLLVSAPLAANDPCLLGARVRLKGVSTSVRRTDPRGDQVLLAVPDGFNVRIEPARSHPPLEVPPQGTAEAAHLPVVTRVHELRSLNDVEARRGYPIRLVGVVTCCGPGGPLFIHDGSAGTYVESRLHLQTTHVGDRVEVTGVSAGNFVPMVDHPRVRTLGRGALPLARPIGPEQLVAGEEDGQWVSVEGVVRSVVPRRPFAHIYVSTGGFLRFPVEVPLRDMSGALELVDARVRVRGVRGSLFNSSRQLADIALVTSGLEMLTVLEPPPRLSSIPLLPVKALLQFVPGQRWQHQVRVKGIVTYASDGELYIRDETGGLPVRGAPNPAAVGDLIEVAGFAGPGLFTPALEDARVLSRGPGAPAVSPTSITAEQAVTGRFDGDLVEIDARLLASSGGQEETRLSLQAGPYMFPAVQRGAEPWSLGLRPGSELRLTGICAVNAARPGVPQGFQILLRSREDVVVRHAGPWWTSRRATWALSALAGIAVLSFAWVFALRRRVHSQAAIIWQRVKRETELQERQRMARELHDTLEQTLTGISLSLEAASVKLQTSPAAAEPLLERAIRAWAPASKRSVVWCGPCGTNRSTCATWPALFEKSGGRSPVVTPTRSMSMSPWKAARVPSSFRWRTTCCGLVKRR